MSKTKKEKVTYEKHKANQNGMKRLIFAGIAIILQGLFVYAGLYFLSANFRWLNIAVRVISIILAIHWNSKQQTGAIKTPWIMLILIAPVLAIFLYLLVGLNSGTKRMKRRYAEVDRHIMPQLSQNKKVLENIGEKDIHGICSYINKYSGYPVYDNSDIEYFAWAKDGYESQIEELKKAEKFIFMEYHAIERAESWQKIEDILVEKVKEGVEVRVIYDDLGSIGFVDKDFASYLNGLGIKCHVFNQFVPFINIFLNNRDHRKVTVIDGKIGYTGGYNIANEYFNITKPYGLWKDTGIKITGPAVKNLTVTFLEMWEAVSKADEPDYSKYIFEPEYAQNEKGTIIDPYADTPLDNLHIGEDVYINMINKANDYCYFTTPYLIPSDELTSALNEAARRGVDVRIITPGIQDKKLVYALTRSFYVNLVHSGVRIYEWTPGFIHAKTSVVDGKMATCGTINLDFRSFNHHFENGCFFADCRAVDDVRKDIVNTFAESTEVTEKYLTGVNKTLKIWQRVLRLVSGLL